MPVIKLDKQDAKDAIGGNHPDFEIVEYEVITDRQRWSIGCYIILLHTPTGKLYQADYSRGVGDDGEVPFEYDDNPEFTEVEKVEVKIFEYIPVKD